MPPKAKAQARARSDKDKARQKAQGEKERERAKKDKEREQALKAREKEKERERKEKERAALLKAKEKERQEKEREQERARKEKERLKREQEKEREQERVRKEKERLKREQEKEREQERVRKEKERLKREQEKEREKLEKERAKEKARKDKEREQERVRKLKEREAQREAQRKAREEERARQKAEREAERERIRLERDAERERIRLEREAERARKEAEREAYRKAKEAERERLRAEREAARRALEGKVARATKRGQRGDGLLGRGTTTTRVYRPDAIPDQSGTTRRLGEFGAAPHLVGIRPPAPATPSAAPASQPVIQTASESPAAPPSGAPAPTSSAPASGDATRATPPPPPALSVEERWARINERLEKTEIAFQREYRESFDMSWIYHDSALEGVVYTFQELKTATDPNITVVPDSSLQPVCEEIRRNRQTIELVRELSEKKRVPLNVDVLKKLYVTLHPEEGDVKTVKYRKDIPQHRLYFHEYSAPDKIAYKVRQVIDWLNGPEPKKMKNALRVAARVHYDLLRIFPFQNDSGKVVRLFMNVILMRSGYPPAIVHSTERQKYYEALKGQLPIIIAMTNEAISNALLSIEKRLDEYEARARGAAAS